MYSRRRSIVDEKSGIKKIIPKNKAAVIVLASVGIVLIIISYLIGDDKNYGSGEYTDVGFYTEYLESRICELCKSIDGINEASVFLTLDCSSEYIYGKEGGEVASDYLILSGNEQAVMLCEIYPKVRGIAVVCTGGDLPRIQQSVTELLSAALGISSGKIKVAGG